MDKKRMKDAMSKFDIAYTNNDIKEEYLQFSRFVQGAFISPTGWIIDTGNYQNVNKVLIEDIYYTKDINTIDYDHLTITDDSEYKVTSEVYKETCPSYYQYWIVYTATDKYDNKSSKTQAIVFEEEPSDDDVKNLADIRSSICTGKQGENPTN